MKSAQISPVFEMRIVVNFSKEKLGALLISDVESGFIASTPGHASPSKRPLDAASRQYRAVMMILPSSLHRHV